MTEWKSFLLGKIMWRGKKLKKRYLSLLQHRHPVKGTEQWTPKPTFI